MPYSENTIIPNSVRSKHILEDFVSNGISVIVQDTSLEEFKGKGYTIVRVISTTNITSLSGLLTIDGITLIANDLVLVNAQTDLADNGIYQVSSSSWNLQTSIPIESGYQVNVREGTVNANTIWIEALEFAEYMPSETEIQFVKNGAGAELEIEDTDSIGLTYLDGVLSADAIVQETATVDLSIDINGIRADAKFQESNYTTVVTSDFDGTMINLKHTDSDTIRIIQEYTGIKCEVIEDSIDTVHLADDSVTTDKIEDGAVTIEKVDPAVYTEYYKRFNISSGGIIPQLIHTVRIPPSGSFFPIGIYEVYVFVEISTQNMFFQTNNNTLPQTLVLIWSLSGTGQSTVIDKTPTHEDLTTGSHKLINSSMQGSAIINVNESTQALRYFEVELNLTANAASFRSSYSGYVHVKQLKAGTELTLET